jgi:hypothetical protein
MTVEVPSATGTGGPPEDFIEYQQIENSELLEDVKSIVTIVQ